MSFVDEIERLTELRQSGALSDEEFEQAKAKLLDADPRAARSPLEAIASDQTLGRAANRYVTLQTRMGVIGGTFAILVAIVMLIMMLFMFFGVFLPIFRHVLGAIGG